MSRSALEREIRALRTFQIIDKGGEHVKVVCRITHGLVTTIPRTPNVKSGTAKAIINKLKKWAPKPAQSK